MDNGLIESFNGRVREECLNLHLFWSFEDARDKLEPWRKDYNTQRPHNALANLPPATFAATGQKLNLNPVERMGQGQGQASVSYVIIVRNIAFCHFKSFQWEVL